MERNDLLWGVRARTEKQDIHIGKANADTGSQCPSKVGRVSMWGWPRKDVGIQGERCRKTFMM